MAPFKMVKLGGKLEVPIICLGASLLQRRGIKTLPSEPPSRLTAPWLLCTGTMTWGDVNPEEEAHEQLDHALAAGVNFIDTAEL